MHRPPVLIFAFNRPLHLKRLLDSICLNDNFKEFEYFIFVDGPRNSIDKQKIDEIRVVIEGIKSVLNICVSYSGENLGISKSIRNNVTEVFKTFDEIIVLEDDLVVSPFFLEFMVRSLSYFRDVKSCSSISGYRYELADLELSAYVLLGADCWGWATWRDRWEQVNWDPKEILHSIEISGRLRDFDIGGNYRYSTILKDRISGFVDSWAINWHASMFLVEKFTYYPQIPLCQNTGIDGSGVHFGRGKKYHVDLPNPDWNLLGLSMNFYNAQKEFEKYHQKHLGEKLKSLVYTVLKLLIVTFRKIG